MANETTNANPRVMLSYRPLQPSVILHVPRATAAHPHSSHGSTYGLGATIENDVHGGGKNAIHTVNTKHVTTEIHQPPANTRPPFRRGLPTHIIPTQIQGKRVWTQHLHAERERGRSEGNASARMTDKRETERINMRPYDFHVQVVHLQKQKSRGVRIAGNLFVHCP